MNWGLAWQKLMMKLVLRHCVSPDKTTWLKARYANARRNLARKRPL